MGAAVPDWTPCALPSGAHLCGRFATLEALDPERHGGDLFDAYSGHDSLWDYLPYGPFPSADVYRGWAAKAAANPALRFYAVREGDNGRSLGVASYLRMDPDNGSIEVGHINFSPQLQRTRVATEAMFLMMQWAFDAGYRRYEWKCDALNIASRRAAQRLGFSFEGVFRQAAVVKGRNRDTAWFAIIDREWPALKSAMQTWLAEENFDARGGQITRLADLTSPIRAASDPLA